MIRLRGAAEVRRLVLKRWASSAIFEKGESCKRSNWEYVRRFACSICGGEAFEFFRYIWATMETPESWEVDWTSECGCVWDGLSSDSVGSRFMEVQDRNGVLVGLIDISQALRWGHWRRFEVSGQPPFFLQSSKSVLFGTLWQAINAPVEECRLLGSIQWHTGLLWAEFGKHTSMARAESGA